MQPVNNINTLPSDLVIYFSNNLGNAAQVVSLAETCKVFLKIFTDLPENSFFRLCNQSLSPNNLYPKIFHLKSFPFISIPCTSITIDLFTRTTTLLCRFFPMCERNVIEGSIRKSLATDTNNKAMRAFSDECFADAKNPEIVAKVKPTLEVELLKSKNEIERRMAELCGPHGFDGAINSAYRAMEVAQHAFDAAFFEFRFKLSTIPNQGFFTC